jgi:hypothetical protein
MTVAVIRVPASGAIVFTCSRLSRQKKKSFVYVDVLAFAFKSQGVGKAHQCDFHCRVVGLAKVAIQSRCRSGGDDPSFAAYT